MYPRQISQPHKNTNMSSAIFDQKKLAKREQLADLLINKFRNKYSVNIHEEREIDGIIKLEVSRFILPGTTVHEKDINELDRTIQNAVKALRTEKQ